MVSLGLLFKESERKNIFGTLNYFKRVLTVLDYTRWNASKLNGKQLDGTIEKSLNRFKMLDFDRVIKRLLFSNAGWGLAIGRITLAIK